MSSSLGYKELPTEAHEGLLHGSHSGEGDGTQDSLGLKKRWEYVRVLKTLFWGSLFVTLILGVFAIARTTPSNRRDQLVFCKFLDCQLP